MFTLATILTWYASSIRAVMRDRERSWALTLKDCSFAFGVFKFMFWNLREYFADWVDWWNYLTYLQHLCKFSFKNGVNFIINCILWLAKHTPITINKILFFWSSFRSAKIREYNFEFKIFYVLLGHVCYDFVRKFDSLILQYIFPVPSQHIPWIWNKVY